ncbi:MAG: 23S rRNA (adenine(2503)-C(2))-methyltransferase RlmN [Candidatus Symbiobacter sp.]|nr:23S rRNA (adenine(2503)-C(2))-methyltransferase RlmN [Candidatus Symbiobacter sp.]
MDNSLSPTPPELIQKSLPSLIGLSREDFTAALTRMGEPAFRAKQLWHWVYYRGSQDFAQMTNLAKDFRARLAATFSIARPNISTDLKSSDGTRKWLLAMADGNEIETVSIPEEDRGTLCVSSQIGCTLTCKFCHTGTQRLVRNLTAEEIVGQVMLARDKLGDWPHAVALRAERDVNAGVKASIYPGDLRQISNIVMMGMGEPLYNFDNVKTALHIIMDGEGISLSRRRITLSTSGVVPMIARCGAEIGVNLAISLHAVRDEVRDILVPLNKKYPIAELLAACATYPGAHNARRITFEYVMLRGVNDSDADARELVRLLRDLPAKVNLIPFNPWPGSVYECSSPARVAQFSEIVFSSGLSAPIRTPRGQDIMAACGQLKSASTKLSVTERGAAERGLVKPEITLSA